MGRKIDGKKMDYRIMDAPASVVVFRPEGATTYQPRATPWVGEEESSPKP